MLLRLPCELRRLVARYSDRHSLAALCSTSWTCWQDAGPVLWHEVRGLRNVLALPVLHLAEVGEKSTSQLIEGMVGGFHPLHVIPLS
jgi:hypothetical protein